MNETLTESFASIVFFIGIIFILMCPLFYFRVIPDKYISGESGIYLFMVIVSCTSIPTLIYFFKHDKLNVPFDKQEESK
jgi:hypothetical protein